MLFLGNDNESSVIIYSETILFPIAIYLFKVTNKSTRKQCEISPKLIKNPTKEGRLQDISDSDIHSSSCKESDFSGSYADSDTEL